MKGRQFPILPLLLLCAMGVCAYWVYENIEFEEVEYQVGQTERARSNPFLAAARLLENAGFKFNVAEDRSVFSSLDVDKTDVLWMADLRELSNQQEVDQIQAWIESGGILLSSPGNSGGFDLSTPSGELLSRLGFRTLEDDEIDDMLNGPEFNNFGEFGEYQWDIPGTDLSMLPVKITSDDDPYFKSTFTDEVSARIITETPFFIQKSVGDGFVTLYSDADMFSNSSIGKLDNGYLLLWLTQPAKLKKLSIVFKPADSPGLFSLLWNKFTLTILILLAVLIGFLRWASTRLGPVEQELPPIQNNLMAHLQARGEYWYRHRYTDKIVENVQHAAIENLAKQTGVATVAGEIDRNEAIRQASKMLDCSPVTAEQALYGKARKGDAVLRASRVLQKINHRKLNRPES